MDVYYLMLLTQNIEHLIILFYNLPIFEQYRQPEVMQDHRWMYTVYDVALIYEILIETVCHS